MDDFSPLSIRSPAPKGSKKGGGTVVVVGGGDSSGSSSGSSYGSSYYYRNYYLPLWLYILIGVLTLIAVIFWWALIYNIVVERRRVKSGKQPRFRLGRVLWKAIEVAFFLWIFTKLFKCCCGRSRQSGPQSYQKLSDPNAAQQQQQQQQQWYGAPAPQPHQQQHQQPYGVPPFVPASEKYEPFSTPAPGPAPPTPAPPYGAPSAYGVPAAAPAYGAGQATAYFAQGAVPPAYPTPAAAAAAAVAPPPQRYAAQGQGQGGQMYVPSPMASPQPSLHHPQSGVGATYVPGQGGPGLY